MTPKARKRLFRLIGLPLLILLILIGIAITLLFTQQERIVHLAIKDLNEKLPGRLEVQSSEISVFQHFPYISIGLQNVKLFPNKSDSAKAIFEAERLYAGFSLPDILKQKYNIKVISLKNGHLDLVDEPDSQLNLVKAIRIATDSTAATPSTKPANLDLDIKKIVLKNMDISYLDPKERQHLFTHIDRIQSSFTDNDQLMDGTFDGNYIVDFTRPGDTTLLRHKHVSTDIRFSYAKATRLLTLPEVRLQVEKALFNLNGTVDLMHDNTVDLTFAGDRPDFKQLFSFAPEQVAEELKHFRYDGVLDFKGTIKGPLRKGVQPRIDLSFSCSNAWLHNTDTKKKLDSLAFTGFYTNGDSMSLKTSLLRINDIYARPGEGRFKANFTMRDFTDPKIQMHVNSDLELGFFGAFLGIRDLERITGRITLKMNFNELVDLSQPQLELSELTKGIQSELTIRDLTFRIPDYPYTVDHLNLHADMKDGFVKLDSLVCNIGHSDFRLDGSLEDLPALFHNQQKPITLNLHAHSRLAVLHELLAKDPAERTDQEELREFNIGVSLQTSVSELRHPSPLPKGQLNVRDLSVSFKKYPHDFHDFGGDVTINDTALLLRNLAGQIDSSDIRFGGKVVNYALWFEKVKRGKTTLGFDLKSHELAIADVVGPGGQKYLPKDIYNEVGSNIWLRSKIELRYDSVFQFANIRIANISAAFQQHPYRLDSISGNIKFGTDNFLKIDTLKGKVGNSDFNLSMRLYTGKDTARRKKENYLRLACNLLDADQLASYAASVEQEEQSVAALEDQPDSNRVILTSDPVTPSVHAQAFNIFQIPFIDFNASVSIGHLRCNHLGIRNFAVTGRMTANQHLYLDTLSMNIAGGSINASAQFDGSNPKKILLHSRINAEDVDMEKLLLKLDYLGQDYVINKNLHGSLSGQVETDMQVHPDLTPLMECTQARIDLEILNGVLVNFAPMQALSSYFGDRNLMMVRFDTLRNSLTFKNGILYIPDMNINSSLGYMEIAGQQSMDTHMEYFLRIPLKLVTQAGFHMLFGKKKEEVDPDQVDAIEYRDKEKKFRCVNVKITGTPDDYKVALGKARKS
jgi:AsmA-like C-terminal region/AsmA family